LVLAPALPEPSLRAPVARRSIDCWTPEPGIGAWTPEVLVGAWMPEEAGCGCTPDAVARAPPDPPELVVGRGAEVRATGRGWEVGRS
jgi:hypothetical protein